MPPSQAQNPSKIHSQTHSIANKTKVWFLHYLPLNLLIFACLEGMEINEKSSENHITVHDEINIDQRHQNISKMLPKTSPKPTKIVGAELGKSTSSLNKALRELPRRFLSSTWPQNDPKILPQGFQNASKMTSECPLRYDHHDIAIVTLWWSHDNEKMWACPWKNW